MTITYTRPDYETGAMKTTTKAVGTTLYTKAQSERVMSDIWEWITSAYYYDEETGGIGSVWLDENTEVTIDYEDNLDAILAGYFNSRYNLHHRVELDRAECESQRPYKGREVRVVSGRTSKGSVGKVVVSIERYYGMGYRASLETKVGIALDDEMTTYVAKNGKTYPTHKNMIWVWARNCEVVDPIVDIAEVEATAKRMAERDVADLQRNLEINNKVKLAA